MSIRDGKALIMQAKRIQAAIILAAFLFSLITPQPAFATQNLRTEAADETDVGGAIGKALGDKAGIKAHSAIVLRLPADITDLAGTTISSFTLDPTDEAAPDVSAIKTLPAPAYRDLISNMRNVLIQGEYASEERISKMTNEEIISTYVAVASKMIKGVIMPFARAYNLDPHTQVEIVIGAHKLASYVRPPQSAPSSDSKPSRSRLIVDINIILNIGILESELLHEVLHPLVDTWFSSIHIDQSGFIQFILGLGDISELYTQDRPPQDYYAVAAELVDDERIECIKRALAELFILKRQIALIKSDPEREKDVMDTLRSDNALDPDGHFTELLETATPGNATVFINQLIDFLNANASDYPDQTRIGIGLLVEFRAKFKEPHFLPLYHMLIESVISDLDDRLNSYVCLENIESPVDMDDMVRSILARAHEVEQLEVRLIDEEGHLANQTKSVLMPINQHSVTFFEHGIPFDGSSMQSSITGRGLHVSLPGREDETDTDLVAVIDPTTFRIRQKLIRGKRTAVVEALVMDPFHAKPQFLDKQIKEELAERVMETTFAPPERYVPLPGEDAADQEAQAREEALGALRKNKITTVQLFLSDWSGKPTILEVPVAELEDIFEKGKGLTPEQAARLPAEGPKAGLFARPDPYSLRIVRYEDHVEAFMFVFIQDEKGQPYAGDFRAKLFQLTQRAKQNGLMLLASPEPEFFLFRRLPDGRYVTADSTDYYSEIGELPRDVQKILYDIIEASESASFGVRYVHGEVSKGQYEIPMQHGQALDVADKTRLYMYLVRRIAEENGLVASFLPKPIKGTNGSGMHLHISLRDIESGANVFYDENGDHSLSKQARYFIGGLLKYTLSITRLTNPYCNSFLRLVQHFEAPVALGWGIRARHGVVRVPHSVAPGATRIEFRAPDPAGDTHAAFWAVLEAGLKGIEQNIEPPAPIVGESLYEMSYKEKDKRNIDNLPGADDFLGIDGEKALKAAIALMLANPDSPFVHEIVQTIEQTDYDSLPEDTKARFKADFGIESDDEARQIHEDMKQVAIRRFKSTVDNSDRREFIQEHLEPEVVAFLSSPEEVDTVLAERESIAAAMGSQSVAAVQGDAAVATGAEAKWQKAEEALTSANPELKELNIYRIFAPSVSMNLAVLAKVLKPQNTILIVNNARQRDFLRARGFIAILLKDNISDTIQEALEEICITAYHREITAEKLQVSYYFTEESERVEERFSDRLSLAVILLNLENLQNAAEEIGITVKDSNALLEALRLQGQALKDV